MTQSTPVGRAVAARVSSWTAEPPLPDLEESTSQAVRATAAEAIAAHRCDHYTRRPGIASLCRRVAAALAQVDVTVAPDKGVVISGGARETRYVTLRTLAARQTVQVPPDLVAAYRPAAALAEATLVESDPAASPADAEGIWIFGENGVNLLQEVHPDAILVVDLLDAATAVPAVLRRLAEIGAVDQTLILGAFGRDTGLAAWNVAWFAGPKGVVAKVLTLKQAMTICTPAPGQYAALAALEGDGA